MTSFPPAPPGTNDQLSPIRSSRPGRESVLREQWRIADLDPIARENVHAQQLSVVRRSDGIEGIGIFEHIAMGPHVPSSLPDGLTPPTKS